MGRLSHVLGKAVSGLQSPGVFWHLLCLRLGAVGRFLPFVSPQLQQPGELGARASPLTHEDRRASGRKPPRLQPGGSSVVFEPGLSAYIPGHKAQALPSGPFVFFATGTLDLQVGHRVAQRCFLFIIKHFTTAEPCCALCLRLSPGPAWPLCPPHPLVPFLYCQWRA